MNEPSLHVLLHAADIALLREDPKFASIVQRYDESVVHLIDYAREIELARVNTNDDFEIDDNPIISAADDGVWVSSWIWVPIPEDDEEDA